MVVSHLRRPDAFAQIDAALGAKLFVEDGVTTTTAHQLGVSPGLFAAWANSPEGQGSIKALQRQLNSRLEARLSTILDEAAHRIVTALKEGNEVLTRDGSIVKVKPAAREAASVFAVAFDRRQLLRLQPTQISDVDQKINDLAEKLKAIGDAATAAAAPK